MNALLKKQPKRSNGGSASLTPSRNTKKTDRRENANDAIKLKLGVSVYDDMQTQWLSLHESNVPSDHNLADGMIIALLSQGFSEVKIRAVLKGLGGPYSSKRYVPYTSRG